MSKFHISQVGREKIKSWHRANINKIANDPIIKEKYSDKIDNIRDCLSSPSTNINLFAEPVKLPIKDVLDNITKDDVIVQKKKKKTTTSLDSLSSEEQSSTPKVEYPHPTHYYKQAEDRTKISAIRVITYNKSFERDMY